MPALDGLEDRLTADLKWKVAYDTSAAQAKVVAEQVPLVHVTSDRTFINYIVPTEGGGPKRRSAKTEVAERALGWEEAFRTYFYAGRACPEFGGVALAFGPECESGRRGAATPFDSGGVAYGYIKGRISNLTQDEIRDFLAQSRIDITCWRSGFARYLAAYFVPLESYWKSRPCRPDPDGIFSEAANDWRAWVFEVVLEGVQDLTQAIAWCASHQCRDVMRRDLVNHVPAFGEERARLVQFLECELPQDGAENYVEALEKWVLARSGL